MRRAYDLACADALAEAVAVKSVLRNSFDGEVAEERAEELELGLNLGGGGSIRTAMEGGFRRILTAEDFPSPGLRASPLSSNSSVSSSPGGLGGDESGGGDSGGSRRIADAVGRNTARSANSLRWGVSSLGLLGDDMAMTCSHSQVVGWPPIRTCRRNNFVNLSRVNNFDAKVVIHQEIFQSCSSNADKKSTGVKNGERKAILAGKSRFVKVNMDGDPIGRKVDLNAHASYETLAIALETMFYKTALLVISSTNGTVSKLLDGSSEYSFIYEDEDGDWMLVGDVPWGMFLHTARRLRIMKIIEAVPGDLLL